MSNRILHEIKSFLYKNKIMGLKPVANYCHVHFKCC